MNVLAIDTSNQIMSIAILKNEQLIGEVVTNLNKNHSTRLMPAIEDLMKEVNFKPEELDRIAVAKGPGSYTGVRIGLTTAKTLAWVLDIPVIGVSSLEILAYKGRFFKGYICPFFDARRGLVYSGVYKWEENKLISIYEDENILMEELLKQLLSDSKDVLFLSPDIEGFSEEINHRLGDLATIPEGPYHLPSAAQLGLASLNKVADSTHSLTPSYLRMAEAESNWLKQQKEKD